VSKPVFRGLTFYPVGSWPRDVSITEDRPDLVYCPVCNFAGWIEPGTEEDIAALACPECRAIIIERPPPER
jgi:hypothetical protein